MTPITLNNIKPKFYPSIINRQDFHDEILKAKVEKAFESFSRKTIFINSKPYIFTLPGLENHLIKGRRTDLLGQEFRADVHLYRVRKALRIQKLIKKNGWDDEITIPKKYLYCHEHCWYVIAERMKPVKKSNPTEHLFHKLSAKKAKAITTIIFETGFTDLTDNFLNIGKNKYALIDSEPVIRSSIKTTKSFGFCRLFISIDSLKITAHLKVSSLYLKNIILDPDIRHEITKIQIYYLGVNQVKTLATIVLLVLAWTLASLIPINFVVGIIKSLIVVKVFSLCLQELLIIKDAYLALIRRPVVYGIVDPELRKDMGFSQTYKIISPNKN